MTHQSLSQQLKASLESLTRQEQKAEYEQWEAQQTAEDFEVEVLTPEERLDALMRKISSDRRSL